MKRLILLVLLTLTFGVVAAGIAQAQGGPVILAGIDAEDGGPGGHGMISVWDGVVSTHYANATCGGTGILVIGGDKDSSDNVTSFWNQIATDTLLPVKFVNGATNVASQSFGGFRMIAVASDVNNTPSGGLTQDENDALTARAVDVAAFVNSGCALLGFTSDFAPGTEYG
jgi:trimeric autotransporter adhesin